MATISVIKLKIRRGTDVQRKQVIFDSGELAYVTDPDSRRLFVGDGVTTGGVSVNMKFYTGSLTSPVSLNKSQVGDLIYNTDNSQLYILSGVDGTGFPDYTNEDAYFNISLPVDNRTISYINNKVTVNTNGVSAAQLSWDVLDTTQGFFRPSSNAPFRVNYDNNSIKINSSQQLYVYLPLVETTTLPRVNPGVGSNLLWVDPSAGNVLKVA
jgi:hypothetical protein